MALHNLNLLVYIELLIKTKPQVSRWLNLLRSKSCEVIVICNYPGFLK